MNIKLLNEIKQLNPWLENPTKDIITEQDFIPRIQIQELMDKEWDNCWTILIGPRRSGKTTLGKYLAKTLIKNQRYTQLLYLNCDYLSIRKWLSSPIFISEALDTLALTSPILFIDEIQRVENPGLLLKAVIDLGLPIKHIATGSSQLEMKSKVKEFLTGRQLTSEILPLSHEEWPIEKSTENTLIYGCYPQVVRTTKKEILITEIYHNYIQKDIIEILKVGNPDVFQTLVSLLAHSAGQLVNYNQLASDCKVSVTMIRNYLDILEQTYVIAKIKPFIGNKRSEITSNPIYYFIDNGFRNVALRNFSTLATRTDLGLLIENFVYQELHKFKVQHYLNFDIHFWRTKSGAEVDFVLYKNDTQFIPIEVKYQNLNRPTISKGFRSFIQAYQPKQAILITVTLMATISIESCTVHFIPLQQLTKVLSLIKDTFKQTKTDLF